MSGSTKRPNQDPAGDPSASPAAPRPGVDPGTDAAGDPSPPLPPVAPAGDFARLEQFAAAQGPAPGRMAIDRPIDLRARAAESGVRRRTDESVQGPAPRASSAGLSLSGVQGQGTEWAELVDSLIGDVILAHVPGRRVLDLGYGSPEIAAWVRERIGDHLSIVEKGALEQMPMKIAEESGFLPASEFLDANGNLILPPEEEDGMPVLRLAEYRDQSFDVVYCLRTFPHLGYDTETSERLSRQLLREAARVTVDGGTVFVQIANPRSLRGLVEGIRNPITVVSRRRMILGDRFGLTRWDTLPRFLRFLPPELEFIRIHGIGVLVPHNATLQIPLFGRLLARLEWRLRDMGVIRRFGGHLLVALRRETTVAPGRREQP